MKHMPAFGKFLARINWATVVASAMKIAAEFVLPLLAGMVLESLLGLPVLRFCILVLFGLWLISKL
jgi:hypothetical protein